MIGVNMNNNQDLFLQNQMQNPMMMQGQIQQQPFVAGQPLVGGQPLFINNNNAGFNNKQQPLFGDQHMHQHHHQHQNVYQPGMINAQIIPMVDNMPNQQGMPMVANINPILVNNPYYQSAEMAYCHAPIRTTVHHRTGHYDIVNVGIGPGGILNALKQVQADLNLTLPQFDIVGNVNLLSSTQRQERIITPIINNNPHVPNQTILSGKIVFCCNTLCSQIQKFGIALLILSLIATIILVIGYAIYFSQENPDANMIAPLIIHLVLWGIEVLVALLGLVQCNKSIISFGVILSIINLLYGFAMIVMTGFQSQQDSFNDGSSSSSGLGICFGVQFPIFILGFICLIMFMRVSQPLKRLFVLLKLIDESELVNSCCS